MCEQYNIEECASLEEECPVRSVPLPFRLLVRKPPIQRKVG